MYSAPSKEFNGRCLHVELENGVSFQVSHGNVATSACNPKAAIRAQVRDKMRKAVQKDIDAFREQMEPICVVCGSLCDTEVAEPEPGRHAVVRR